MAIESSDYGHFVSFEDAQTHEVLHFSVGKDREFHFLGGRTPNTGIVPSQVSQAYRAAETAAVQHFKEMGVL